MMNDNKRSLLLLAVLGILILFMVVTSSSPPEVPATTSSMTTTKKSASLTSNESATVPTRRFFWQPQRCMNWFASRLIVEKMKRVINWSGPLDIAASSNNNTNRSARQRQRQSQYPCSFWRSGVWHPRMRAGYSATRGSLRWFRHVARVAVPRECATVPNQKLPRPNWNVTSSAKRSALKIPRTMEDCAVGVCWATSIARLARGDIVSRKRRRSAAAAAARVPFLILIGDSRVRNMLQRFVMMVRSNQPDSESEMQRAGVVDNYWHQNATYIVSERGDEIKVLPIGVGCDSPTVLNSVNSPFHFEARRYRATRSNSSPSSSPAKSPRRMHRTILVVCLLWHFRTVPTRVTPWDVDVTRMLATARPDSVVWMPTLHDCVRGACTDENGAFAPRVSAFADVLSRALLEERLIRNRLVFVTAPSAVWAPAWHLGRRNRALLLAAAQHAKWRFTKNNASTPDDVDDRDENDNGKQTTAVDDDEEDLLHPPAAATESSSPAVRVFDAAAWVDARDPIRCDRVHNMCNFRPMMGFGNVTHFRAVCNRCADLPDFCFWMRVRAALV